MSRQERDDHHLCNYAKEWSARPEGLAIRTNNSMIARNMGRVAHELCHYMTAPVPVPEYHSLRYVSQRLPSGLEVLSGIDTYSSLLEEASRHPRAKFVDKQLNELSISAMRAQIPYIKDGMPSKRKVIV